jgi:hypothetical protein
MEGAGGGVTTPGADGTHEEPNGGRRLHGGRQPGDKHEAKRPHNNVDKDLSEAGRG